MSLTFLGRATLFMVLSALIAWSGGAYGPAIASYLAQARNSIQGEARISDRAIVYRMPRDRAVSFAFSQPVTHAKLLVQPAVGEADRAREKGFVYGLRIRMFDGDGTQVAIEDVYLQADAPDTVFTSGEVWRFFRNRPELVGEQDQVLIDSAIPAVRIEIEELDPDPAMLGVDVRVYEQRPFLSAQPLATFRRMSESGRRELAAANVFPPEMLTRKEMENIAINQWRPVGPQGIEGRDYQALVLYESSKRARKGALK